VCGGCDWLELHWGVCITAAAAAASLLQPPLPLPLPLSLPLSMVFSILAAAAYVLQQCAQLLPCVAAAAAAGSSLTAAVGAVADGHLNSLGDCGCCQHSSSAAVEAQAASNAMATGRAITCRAMAEGSADDEWSMCIFLVHAAAE
jgi:hypothetical protein